MKPRLVPLRAGQTVPSGTGQNNVKPPIDIQEGERLDQMLEKQAAKLNALFFELVSKSASSSMVNYLEAADRYMRLALKAQAQCRATFETLAATRTAPRRQMAERTDEAPQRRR